MISNARRANAANILKKIQAGKVVSKAERAELEEVQSLMAEEKAPAQPSHPLDLPTDQVADFFGVTRKCVADWVKAGCPKVRYGVYNLKAVYDWRADNIEVRDGDNSSLIELKAENLRIKNEKDRALTDEVKGRLISRQDVIYEWAGRAMELRSSLRAWSSRLPPLLEGQDVHRLRELLRDEADKLLTTYCRDGRFTPAAKTTRARRATKRRKTR